MRILLLSLGILFAQELEVQGDLKVTGSVDASGNPITNVGEPVLTTDVATANYVLERTTSKGRIIILKCPWQNWTTNHHSLPGVLSCEPPECPEGWSSLETFNEIISVSIYEYGGANAGNSIRYCIEQEDEE